MTRKVNTFFDLVPFSGVEEKYAKSHEQLKNIFIEGIRKNVHFYAANQSDKYVRMIRWGYDDIEEPPYERRLHEEIKLMIFMRGEMLPIIKIDQFDKLFKGVLNEIDLFNDIDGFDELIEYQQTDHLYHMHAEGQSLTLPSSFRDIDLKHIFIRTCDLETIADTIKGDTTRKENIQAKREMAFIEWMKDKDPYAISNMKKDDVWKKLQTIDQKLFSAGLKHFFRIQKIITFKSGQRSKM